MNLLQRIDVAIDEFAKLYPDWDVTVTGWRVERSDRGVGPGVSIYIRIFDGMAFEVPLEPGDEVQRALGQLHAAGGPTLH